MRCPICHGGGKLFKNGPRRDCEACHGTGQVVPNDPYETEGPDTKYWVDDFGFMWRGPCETQGPLKYMRLEGVYPNGEHIWVWLRETKHECFDELPFEFALKILKRYEDDAISRAE